MGFGDKNTLAFCSLIFISVALEDEILSGDGMVDYFIDEQLIRHKPKPYRPLIKARSMPANRKTPVQGWSGASGASSSHPLQLEQSDSPNHFEVTPPRMSVWTLV